MPTRRRSAGEGAIYADGEGFRGALWVDLADGKRIQKKVRGKSRREVSEKLEALKRQHAQQGGLASDERLTTGAWLQRYLTDVQGPHIRPSTRRQQQMIVTRHLVPALGRTPLAKLRPADIQGYLARKLDGHAPGYVAQHYAILAHALRVAVDWNLIPRSPADRVKPPPKTPVRKPVVLDEQQARDLLAAARAERLGAFFALALTTTMREGEILGLHWDDLDLTRGRVHVRRTLNRVEKTWLEGPPKTPSSERVIELAAWVCDWLREHQARQAAERARVDRWEHPDLVFTGVYRPGSPVNAGVLRLHILPRVLRRAGLDGAMRPHDLRKTAITLYLSAGEDLKVVQRMAGHASPAMTLHVYRNLLPDEAREAVDRYATRLDPTCESPAQGAEAPRKLPAAPRRGTKLA